MYIVFVWCYYNTHEYLFSWKGVNVIGYVAYNVDGTCRTPLGVIYCAITYVYYVYK